MVERGPRSEGFGSPIEAPRVNIEAEQPIAVPEKVESADIIETVEQSITPEPKASSTTEQINLPDIKAVANGAQTAAPEALQAAMMQQFENPTSDAA